MRKKEAKADLLGEQIKQALEKRDYSEKAINRGKKLAVLLDRMNDLISAGEPGIDEFNNVRYSIIHRTVDIQEYPELQLNVAVGISLDATPPIGFIKSFVQMKQPVGGIDELTTPKSVSFTPDYISRDSQQIPLSIPVADDFITYITKMVDRVEQNTPQKHMGKVVGDASLM